MIAGGLSAPTNSLGGIAAATVSPALAYEIGQYFKENNTEGSTAHLLAHAALGAAVAAAGGNNALVGAVSAAGAEAAAPALAHWLYGKVPTDLTADEKQTISSIVGLAGAAVGASTGNTADVASGSQLGQNVVENNALKAVISTAKIAYKAAQKVVKNGKINYKDLKDILKKEGLDILDNAITLTDGQLTWDDAKAIIDLAAGTSLNKANRGEAVKKINTILEKNRQPVKTALETTAAATKAAQKLGFSKTNNYPFNSHGQAVYKKGNIYITRDIDGHNGGVWKIFDSKGNRKGTADANLNLFKD